MKIGLVCPYNITKEGGVQQIVRKMQTELNARGHDVVIITPQPREPYTQGKYKIAFLGTAADFRSPLHTTPQFSVSVMTDEIDSLLEYEQFDLLHFHEPWVPVLSRQILSRSRAANVATFHAKLPETFMSQTVGKVFTPYTKPLIKYIDQFTAVSDPAAEYLLSLAPVPVTIIPNGIDLKHFKKLPPKTTVDPDQPKTVLYVGRLEHRKGVKYLIDAFALLQAHLPDARLLIAGDGPDREKLEQQVQDLGVQHVEFLGYIDETTKRRLLHTADLFCSPALFGESFGIVLLEAMASSLVTIAGNNPGYESVMQGLGKLSIVNPKDASGFAHRLELLLTDDDLRALWKKWAKDYVKQFDYPNVIDQYEVVYETALRQHKAS